MDISSLQNLSSLSNVTSDFYKQSLMNNNVIDSDKDFGTVLNSVMSMVNEASSLHNAAESAEIEFALGKSVNSHDLKIAQEKASVALQYTVAVRDKFIEAYKEIMNMQI